jgi:hypothetical protein
MHAYREEDFPVTIVRPSLTYNTVFPIAIGGREGYTLADKLERGEKIIVHDDGTSLFTRASTGQWPGSRQTQAAGGWTMQSTRR